MKKPRDEPQEHVPLFAVWRWEQHEQIGCSFTLIVASVLLACFLFMVFGAINAR